MGIAGFLFFQAFPYYLLKKFAVIFLLINIVLMVLVFIPSVGYEFNGAQRWINIKGFSFQPSEFLKLTLIIYLAALFENKRQEVKKFWTGLVPFTVIVGVVALLLILQPDIGTLGVISLAAIVLYFIAGAKIRHLLALTLVGLAGLILVIKMAPYRLARIAAFLDVTNDPLGISYQINQALIAIGSGGFFGAGLGYSRQKFNYLPEPIGDSVFAIAAEEMGFVGAFIIIFLFVLFAWRGYKIARKAPDMFGRLLASGIVSYIIIQAFINIGAISGLIPLTGIPLPFISYGGTAIVTALSAAGIVINISKHTSL